MTFLELWLKMDVNTWRSWLWHGDIGN